MPIRISPQKSDGPIMKTIYLILTMTLGALFSHVQAQQSLITGTLTDSISNTRLPGATVYIDGSTQATFTNLTGEYALRTNRTGEAILVISYIGYETIRVPITLTADGNQNINRSMKPAPGELSEIVVSGNLQGDAKALNQQKAASNIINVVAADQIGRFPDPNAAEALQRVQGVNIERDQGEGRYVLIRGLAPQFTNISINGEQIPSPEADVRFVALDAIPSDQLASMEISKTLTPDLDGDAIGGSVNLITRTATSADPTIRASGVFGYNNLMQQPNGQGSFQYGQRFLNNKLGVMANSSYYVNNLGSNGWERDTDGDLLSPESHVLELRDYELTRTRTGLSSTIDYRFNDRNEIYGRVMYNRFTDREWRRRFVFVPEDDEVEKLTKDRYEEQSITSINVGGRHNFTGFRIDYEGSYAHAEQDTPFDQEVGFIASGLPSAVDYSPGNYPRLSAPGYLNNSSYELDEYANGFTLATDENLTAKVNVAVPYNTGSSSGILKFGGKVRFKTKTFTINESVYEAISGVPNADAFAGGLLDENYLDGNFELSAFPDISRFAEYFNANPERFELQIEDKIVAEALEAYEAEEDVMAGYVMTTHNFRKWTVIAGLRYEYTKVAYRSKEIIFGLDESLAEIVDVVGESDYGYILPQLNFRYDFTENTIVRGAATYSYSRPNFVDIIPAQEANLRDREASIGNPDLTPVSALNLDLFAEHYMKNLGIISGGVYAKRLDDFIYSRRFQGPYPLLSPNPLAEGVNYTQSQNGGRANLYGLEFGLQRQLDFLPGKLKGLGVYANYTYTSSDAEFQRTDETALESIKLPGQATHVGNFSLAYNSDKFTLRAAMNLNGSYLTEIGATANDDIFVNSRLQFDLTGGYKISKNWRVFAEFLNLTNQPFELYSGTDENLIQREFYSWWSRIGVKFDLN